MLYSQDIIMDEKLWHKNSSKNEYFKIDLHCKFIYRHEIFNAQNKCQIFHAIQIDY